MNKDDDDTPFFEPGSTKVINVDPGVPPPKDSSDCERLHLATVHARLLMGGMRGLTNKVGYAIMTFDYDEPNAKFPGKNKDFCFSSDCEAEHLIPALEAMVKDLKESLVLEAANAKKH